MTDRLVKKLEQLPQLVADGVKSGEFSPEALAEAANTDFDRLTRELQELSDQKK